jgi:uncharacterized repeat protein (TIGR01451 family)
MKQEHKMKLKKGKAYWLVACMIFCCLSLHSVVGQVMPDINSGNPRFPFPQFKNYQHASGTTLQTLASQNSPGVPHAEMEQRMRDAYRILLNNTMFTGDAVGGVNYIRMDNTTCTCAEGYGYFLLAMAYMGDKTNFDRMWMFVHDNSIVHARRYLDGQINAPGKLYSIGLSGAGNYGSPVATAGGSANGDAAADGDVDIALALMMANMQWGPNSGIVPAATGVEISYRDEALSYIKGMSDSVWTPTTNNPNRYTSGDVGFDGYFKSGPTFAEQTAWASGGYAGRIPEYQGPTPLYFDYMAPAYFRQYRMWMGTLGAGYEWNMEQFRRCEAASDWQMGQLIGGGATRIPFAGRVTMTGSTTATFSNVMPAEDVRAPWRTILNYVWHGDPDSSWNPTTHQVQPGGNTIQRDAGLRYAAFLKNNQAAPWGNPCKTYGTSPVTYNGVPALSHGYDINGASPTTFHINWLLGTGAPAAVTAQDFELMGELFRECVIEWDQQNGGQHYLDSKPVYFHEWFRLLGMLVLSGNAHAPLDMVPGANMKVYKAVDKTFAYPGDELTYTISYRNYGSVAATNVLLSDIIPAGLEFVSASNGGTFTGGSVSWNLGTVPGFVTGGLAATQGEVTLVVRVLPEAAGRLCNVATITCSNGTGWESNEYPNNKTDVMERNCVDIVERPLFIEKEANVRYANPGQTVEYTLDFGNRSTGWLNGGRPGVTLAYANNGTAAGNQLGLKLRLYHGADEAYINYKNYRISYFLNDASTNWVFSNTIYDGGAAAGVTTTQQNLNPGSNADGAWNQRIIVQFADQLCTTAPHLYLYNGVLTRIHEGGANPLRAVWNVHLSSYASVNWADDWSADNTLSASDGHGYYPITNDWTDPNNPDLPIDRLHKHACEIAPRRASKVLVEEWDGYTWRRAFGNAPVSGREIENVVVRDVLPPGVTFGGFTVATTLGVTATYNSATRTINWTIPLMRINDIGQLKYWVTVDDETTLGGCPIDLDLINVASIGGVNESLLEVRDTVTVTCNPLPPPPPPLSSLSKTILSPKTTYVLGDSIYYELEYVNTSGSVAAPDLNTATDWTRQSGSGNFTFGSGRIATVNNQNTVMTYGYSHGTNGTLSGTINPTSSAVVGVAMRHTGGAVANGVYVTFKPNSGAGNVEIKFWNGATMVSSGTYALMGGAFDYHIQLSEDTIRVWLNNTSGSPLVYQTGMNVQAGHAGIINGDPLGADSYASHQILTFRTHLDSGFDLEMYDPVPPNLVYKNASDGGTEAGGVVRWPATNVLPTDPLLAGGTIVRSWWAVVDECDGGFISNTAYIRVRGVTPDAGAQALASCDATPTPVTWLYFTAENKLSGNLLRWATASETNNDYFVVERSDDGTTFAPIHTLPGGGNSRTTLSYTYTDYSASAPVTYYRVRQVDYDGQSSSTEIKRIARNSTLSVVYFPNPFGEYVTIQVYAANEYVTLTIASVVGIEVQKIEVPANQEIRIGENLPSGTYIVTVGNGEESERIRLVKNE